MVSGALSRELLVNLRSEGGDFPKWPHDFGLMRLYSCIVKTLLCSITLNIFLLCGLLNISINMKYVRHFQSGNGGFQHNKRA